MDHPARRIGRFDIVRELGRGGFGLVYKGFDEALDRYAAVKRTALGGRPAFQRPLLGA